VTLLVPLDGTKAAEAAVAAGVSLAKRFRSQVVLFHLLEEHASATVHGERHLTAHVEAEAYLSMLGKAVEAQSLATVKCVIRTGMGDEVAKGIAEQAETSNAHLTLMAPHAAGGRRGQFFGSLAHQVLQGQRRPVLVLPPRSALEPKPFEPTQLIVPVGRDLRRTRALPLAGALASGFAIPIRLVLVPPPSAPTTAKPAPRTDAAPDAAELEKDFERVAAALRAEGPKVTTEVLEANPVSGLLDRAAQAGSLFVLTAHPRLGMGGVLEGDPISRLISRFDGPFAIVCSDASPGDPVTRPG
jgi:nucleotide-binding universal stress UspA family protein